MIRTAARSIAALAVAGALAGCAPAPSGPPLRIVVMDPLALPLACDCVAGYAQRDYAQLASFLERRLGRPVEVRWAEALTSDRARIADGADLIIGKLSVALHDAERIGLRVRTIAMLTGQDGETTQTGLFVVRHNDRAKTIEDLKGYRLLFGPKEADEKHAAALATCEAFAITLPPKPATSPSCAAAAVAVIEHEADAAVISSYCLPLLEGCGTIEKGEVRVVGHTAPVPFIACLATYRVDAAAERKILDALLDVRRHRRLLRALESKRGFVPLPASTGNGASAGHRWPDWRGPRRDAITADLPAALPERKHLLWSRVLTGPGMSGLAVADGSLVVADKSLDDKLDIWRCLDADTGRERWTLRYPAPGEMDFTNSPRASPVIHQGLVHLLGAFGDLHCVRLATGEVLWKTHLRDEFGAELPTWGFVGTPLLVGDKLVVSVGAKQASVVALDRRTGKTVWKTPGIQPGYSSFILATFGGVRQIAGYDASSIGGWDPETGRRLWQLYPPEHGDYNVPTPIATDGRLLVTTENNGTRLYAFDGRGRIVPEPVAVNDDLAHDTATPVVVDGLVFGADGRLLCLDARTLKTLWTDDRDEFSCHCTFIGGRGRVLVITLMGELWLFAAERSGPKVLSRLALFRDIPDTEMDVWSHPALVGNRLYVRNLLGVYCFLLTTDS